MKRWILVFTLLLALMVSSVSIAAVDYTLPEKMQLQIDFGSGVKGNVVLHAEGNDPAILLLQPFQDIELQFRGLRSGNEAHYFAYQAGKDESRIGLTELLDRGNMLYLRSDLLPDEVFSLPGLEELSDRLSDPEGGNPSMASVLFRWMKLKPEERSALLDPVVAELSSQLEIWISQFASKPTVRTLGNGASVVDLNCAIPMSELKEEMVRLMGALISSPNGQALLKQLLNDSQLKVFANGNLAYFYEQALSALDNDYDVLYTRTVSILGTPVSSALELPLDDAKMKYQSLMIEEKEGIVSYTLRGEDQIITLITASQINLQEIDAFSVWYISRPNPAADNPDPSKYHALKMEISRSTETSTDEDAQDHERTNWTVEIMRDVSRLPEGENETQYPDEIPVKAGLSLHYFSRYSKSSPTTLEFEGSISKLNEFSLNIQGWAKTTSSWIFTPFQTDNAVDLSRMSTEGLNLKLAEFLAAAGEQFLPPDPEEELSEESEGGDSGDQPETDMPEAETDASSPQGADAPDIAENEADPASTDINQDGEENAEESFEPSSETESGADI